MTRKERLVREAATEIMSKVYYLDPLPEDEKRVRKILRKLYDVSYGDGYRACERFY